MDELGHSLSVDRQWAWVWLTYKKSCKKRDKFQELLNIDTWDLKFACLP